MKNTVRYLLRDDDISFFTRPEDLEAAWGWYYARPGARLNLAVIPFVKAAEFGAHKEGGHGLGENVLLLEYLRQKVRERTIEILMHGFDHDSCKDGFEFQSRDREVLAERLRVGRQYLEDIFQARVSWFVPPHNAISAAGLAALKDEGMHLLAAVPFSGLVAHAGFGLCLEYVRRLAFGLRHRRILQGKFLYPFVNRLAGVIHLDCFGFIPQEHQAADLIALAGLVNACNGLLCLATHHAELDAGQREKLRELVRFLEERQAMRACFASEINGERL